MFMLKLLAWGYETRLHPTSTSYMGSNLLVRLQPGQTKKQPLANHGLAHSVRGNRLVYPVLAIYVKT